MIVFEKGGHANGLAYFVIRFLSSPHVRGQGIVIPDDLLSQVAYRRLSLE